MVKVIVDEALRNKLHQFSESIELCNESGEVLARVTPAAELVRFEKWEPPMNEEELQRIEQSDEWYTTQEVLDHLKRMEKP